MSKYPFFAKKGRPSSNEREICRKINQLINGGQISESEVQELTRTNGVPETEEELEILYNLLTGEDSKGVSQTNDDVQDVDYEDYSDNDIKQSSMNNNNSSGGLKSNASGGSSESPINFTPFSEPVIERSYTKGVIGQQEDDYVDNHSEGKEGVQFDENDLQRPVEEDIPEPEWAGGLGGSPSNNQSEEDLSQEGFEGEGEYADEKLGGDNLEDLSPAQKRKSAEKTAEAILNMYCNFAPLPFKKWSSISDGKVQKLVFENKIDLNMQLENNVTVKDYIDGVNTQVDEVFTVSDETREEIKDPLIDVLLEQELALTPTQRLMLAVGSHLVTMTFSAFQLAQNNKVALETFEKYHRQMNEQKTSTNTGSNQQPRQTASRPVPNEDSFNVHDRQATMDMIKEMEGMDTDIIDPEIDPNVEVTEGYE